MHGRSGVGQSPVPNGEHVRNGCEKDPLWAAAMGKALAMARTAKYGSKMARLLAIRRLFWRILALVPFDLGLWGYSNDLVTSHLQAAVYFHG